MDKPITLLIFYTLLFFVSVLMTLLLRRYAISKSLFDLPNKRSSHDVPTPRGGGMAIVVSFLLGTTLIFIYGNITLNFFAAIAGSGMMIAAVGFIDDHISLPSKVRLVFHFISAIWVLYWLGIPDLSIFGVFIESGWVSSILASFFLVWLLNLYNFMDGIDGLASVECITVCLFASLILYFISGPTEEWVLTLLLASCVSGFLIWNLPPASIFMGDVGSAFLGIILGAFVINSSAQSHVTLWWWLILLGVFIVDSTYTIVMRVLSNQRFDEAHRSHSYQILSRKYSSHTVVIVYVCIVNAVWLFPIAFFVANETLNGTLGLLIAYTPLVIIAWKTGAGMRNE